MEKGFWWAVGLIQVMILGLLGYLAKSNNDLQQVVVELNTTIKVSVQKNVERNERKIEELDEKLQRYILAQRSNSDQ